MKQTWENGKKPSFGPGFGQMGPNFGRPSPPPPPKKNLASSVSRYPGQLSYNTISEKTNGPVLKTRSGGWTADGRE